MGDRAVTTVLATQFFVFGPHKFTDLACMFRMRLYLVIRNLPLLRLFVYPHLYCQRSYIEIRELSKCVHGEINVLGSLGEPGARINHSDKATSVLSDFAYCDSWISTKYRTHRWSTPPTF